MAATVKATKPAATAAATFISTDAFIFSLGNSLILPSPIDSSFPQSSLSPFSISERTAFVH
jgi:hypothetical protein